MNEAERSNGPVTTCGNFLIGVDHVHQLTARRRFEGTDEAAGTNRLGVRVVRVNHRGERSKGYGSSNHLVAALVDLDPQHVAAFEDLDVFTVILHLYQQRVGHRSQLLDDTIEVRRRFR